MSIVKAQSVIAGKIIPDNEEKSRDAVHIAVVPAICNNEGLFGGELVKFVKIVKDDLIEVAIANDNNDRYIGVVDPFITGKIQAGEKFWLFLKPNLTFNLRHAWEAKFLNKEQ